MSTPPTHAHSIDDITLVRSTNNCNFANIQLESQIIYLQPVNAVNAQTAHQTENGIR